MIRWRTAGISGRADGLLIRTREKHGDLWLTKTERGSTKIDAGDMKRDTGNGGRD